MMSKLMAPDQCKKDQDVLGAVEAWEDRHRECVKQGMTPMEEEFKMVCIRMIATDEIRRKLDDKKFNTYAEQREEATRISRRVRLDGSRRNRKKRCPYGWSKPHRNG